MSAINVLSRHRSRGFTLLEVLVAFTILGLSLAVIYQVFGQGLRAAGLSEKYTRATILAQSLLSETGVTSAVESGTRSGLSANGYVWQVTTTAYAEPPPEEETPSSYQVTVEVGWGDSGQQLTLTSIRLGDSL